MKDVPRKDRWLCFLEALIILNASVVYTCASGSAQTLIPCFAGCVAAVAIRRPIRFSSRTLIYGGVLVLLLTTIESQFFPEKPGQFFLGQTGIYGPGLLYASTVLLFFDHRRYIPSLITSFGLLVLLMAGGVVGLPKPEQAPLVPHVVLNHFRLFYRLAAVVQVVVMTMVFRRDIRVRRTGNHRMAYRFKLLAGGALVLVFLGSLLLERAALRLEPGMSRWYTRMMQIYLRGNLRRVLFDSEVNLWETVPGRGQSDQTVILRVFSGSNPGYLRGRAYAFYANGQWTVLAEGQPMTSRAAEGFGTYSVFRRVMPPNDNAMESMTILPQVELITETLFAAGTASRFELVADGLENMLDGTIIHIEWDRRAAYRVRRAKNSGDAYPLPVLANDYNGPWLEISDEQKKALAPFLAQAYTPEPRTNRERMIETVQYLRSQCRYELGVEWEWAFDGEIEAPVDPVIQFIGTLKKGHCEMFATAAVLMLRAKGIPARYVTGVVCSEPTGDYWVARMEHLHAWAEAYDAASGQWVLVEATPPAGLPQHAPGDQGLGQFFEWVKAHWQHMMARIRRGEFAEIIVSALEGIWNGFLGMISSFFFWMAVAFLMLVFRGWQTVKHRRSLPTDKALADLSLLFNKVEKYLAKRGFERQDSETVNEFIGRIEKSDLLGNKKVVCTFLRRYEQQRYHHRQRSQAAVRQLQTDWKSLKQGIKKGPVAAHAGDEEEV